MSETKPFTVKITASQPGSWYSTYIGSKMIVYEYEGYLYLLEDFDPYAIGIGRYIRKEDCEVVPTPNPADMPSRHVDAEKLDRLDKEVDKVLERETDETLRAWADSQPAHSRPVEEWQHNEWIEVFKAYSRVNKGLKSEADIWLELSKKYSLVPRPAPSKEGASQSSIPEEIMQWIDNELKAAIFFVDPGRYVAHNYTKIGALHMYRHLQSQFSSMKEELNDEKQHSQTLVTDLEFQQKEAKAYRTAWIEAAAILEGKNLEIAQLGQQVAEMREALEEAHKWASEMKYPGGMSLVEKAWEKYKKEEQK